jgi:hypothetical protein
LSPKLNERRPSSAALHPSPLKDSVDSPEEAEFSSTSSSSLSDPDHPAHRSQLFKRPPRFKQPHSRDLSTLGEGDGAQEVDESGSHGTTSLPFASAARPHGGSKHAQDTLYQTTSKPEQRVLTDRKRTTGPARQESINQQSQATTDTASSLASSASASDAPVTVPAAKSLMSPTSYHRAELGRQQVRFPPLSRQKVQNKQPDKRSDRGAKTSVVLQAPTRVLCC